MHIYIYLIRTLVNDVPLATMHFVMDSEGDAIHVPWPRSKTKITSLRLGDNGTTLQLRVTFFQVFFFFLKKIRTLLPLTRPSILTRQKRLGCKV